MSVSVTITIDTGNGPASVNTTPGDAGSTPTLQPAAEARASAMEESPPPPISLDQLGLTDDVTESGAGEATPPMDLVVADQSEAESAEPMSLEELDQHKE